MQIVVSCFDLPHTEAMLSGSTVVKRGLMPSIIPSDADSHNYGLRLETAACERLSSCNVVLTVNVH